MGAQIDRIIVYCIVLFSLVLRCFNLNYNSPFFDEATYIMIGKSVFAGTWLYQDLFSWVGGLPLFYPVLSGVAYTFGGILGARLLNVFLGIISIVLFYFFCRNLPLPIDLQRKKQIGFMAAILLSISPIHLSLSRMAIYDMLSFTLLLAAIILLFKAFEIKQRKYYLASGILLTLAFLAKYSILFTLPIIYGYAVWHIRKLNSLQKQNMIIFIGTSGAAILLYCIFFLRNLFFNYAETINNDFLTSLRIISASYLELTLPWYVFGIIAAYVFKAYRKLIISLILLSFFPYVIHIAMKNTNAAGQSALFSLLLLLPLSAVLSVTFIQKRPFLGMFATAFSLIVLLVLHTVPLQNKFEHFWSDTRKAMDVLKKQTLSKDIILAESGPIVSLALEGRVPSENIIGPYYFVYKGKQNIEAYKLALTEGYFTYVQLDNSFTGFTNDLSSSLTKQYAEFFNENGVHLYRRK